MIIDCEKPKDVVDLVTRPRGAAGLVCHGLVRTHLAVLARVAWFTHALTRHLVTGSFGGTQSVTVAGWKEETMLTDLGEDGTLLQNLKVLKVKLLSLLQSIWLFLPLLGVKWRYMLPVCWVLIILWPIPLNTQTFCILYRGYIYIPFIEYI